MKLQIGCPREEYKKKMLQAFDDTEIYVNKYRKLTRIPIDSWKE